MIAWNSIYPHFFHKSPTNKGKQERKTEKQNTYETYLEVIEILNKSGKKGYQRQ